MTGEFVGCAWCGRADDDWSSLICWSGLSSAGGRCSQISTRQRVPLSKVLVLNHFLGCGSLVLVLIASFSPLASVFLSLCRFCFLAAAEQRIIDPYESICPSFSPLSSSTCSLPVRVWCSPSSHLSVSTDSLNRFAGVNHICSRT